MGTITARYPGRCAACGGVIRVGEQMDYTHKTARHLACAGGQPATAPTSGAGPSGKQVAFALRLLGEAGYSTRYMDGRFKELGATMRQRSGSVSGWLEAMTRAEMSELIDRLQADARASAKASAPEGPSVDDAPRKSRRYPTDPPEEGAHEISGRRTGRGDARYEPGQCIHAPKVAVPGGGPDGHYYTVLAAKLWPPNEDNQQFGWSETAWVRSATDDEAAPVVARLASARAARLVPRHLDQLVTAGERVPEAEAQLEAVAPLARTVWEWVAPTKSGAGGVRLASDVSLRVQRVRVLDDCSVVGHHGGHYDDYRPSAWIVRAPSDGLLTALAALTGADTLLPVAADAAEAAGVRETP